MRQMHRVSWGLVMAATFACAACGKGGESAPPITKSSATAATPVPTAAATARASATASAAATPAPESTAEAEKAAKELRGHHRHHHHGGVAMFIHMAIDTLGVPPEKKAQLEKIQSEPLREARAVEGGRAQRPLAARDGVAAGKIDKAKVDAAVKKQEAAAAKVHEATIEALNQLHAALSPAERVALVTRSRPTPRSGRRSRWRRSTAAKEAGRLAELTEELSLTPDQVEKSPPR